MSINFQNTKFDIHTIFMRVRCMSLELKRITLTTQSRCDSQNFNINVCTSKVIQYICVYRVLNNSV